MVSIAQLWKAFRVGDRSTSSQKTAVPNNTPSGTASGPNDPGLALLPVESILDANQDLIARIKLCYGCDNATFADDLLQPIRRYLRYVNQLPATPDRYFSRAGGLARVGLETGFYALQATDSQIFAGRTTITNRRVLEPRWRRATFIAGLCSELHRALSLVRVSDGRGMEWQPYLGPLSNWCEQARCGNPVVRWVAGQETRALGLFALPMIIPAETMADLATGNSTIVPHMMASIAGATMYHEHNVMDRLVRHAAALVIHRDLRRLNAGHPRASLHMVRYLIEAMRELLLSNHAWQPNLPRSRVWYGQDGLYLVWPGAIADVIKLLQDERLPGIPENASSALDVLAVGGLTAGQDEECRVWTICPPDATESIQAIKLSPPTAILSVLTPKPRPLPLELCRPSEQACDVPHLSTETPHVHVEEEGAVPGPEMTSTRPKREKMQAARDDRQMSLPEFGQELDPGAALASDVAQPEEKPAPGRGKSRSMPSSKGPKAMPSQQNDGGLALQAPMRLNPAVGRVLAEIVGTLDGPPPAACHVVENALFVPLGELARRGIDARQAQRALNDAGMLAPQSGGERIHTRVIGDAKLPGLLVNAECIRGLRRPAAYEPPGANNVTKTI